MLASCCHGTAYLPDKRLGQLLQQWGGDEDEEGVQEATQVEDRERRLKVLGEDLTALELKEVLQVLLVSHLLVVCLCEHFFTCVVVVLAVRLVSCVVLWQTALCIQRVVRAARNGSCMLTSS